MANNIKRSQFKTFLNVTPKATDATYALIGDGVTSGAINYNPKTTEEVYIHQDSGTTMLDSYAPTLPLEASAKAGDDVFEFVDDLRIRRAVGSDADSDIVNVWLYQTPTAGEYPAERQPVSVQVDEFGGDAGQSVKIKFAVNFKGDAVKGTFNPVTLKFTPA